MARIEKLPESLIRLIAAGEVVERPASVVKELLENSLDAGASRVDLDIWGAGRTRIRVADDGEGMLPEDAEQSIDRHATSKLRSFDDLQSLHTFGFRGEALPSIAAVSRLSLSTRAAGQAEGLVLALEGGKVLSRQTTGRPYGTTIDVQDLFFNTPARSKFLKRDNTERTHILKTIQELALVHPRVHFSLTMDGKSLLSLPAADELAGRLSDLWGLAVMEKLLPLVCAQGPCGLRGFVNAIPGHHPTKAYQILFVNNRPVQQRMLTHAIYEAYHEWLPVSRHPVFALFVDIDPSFVDVNVHPSKREVRFSDERAVYDLLYSKIRLLFKGNADSPSMDGRPGVRWTNAPSQPSLATVAEALALQMPMYTADAPLRGSSPSTLSQSMLADAPAVARSFDDSNLRLLGIFNKLYLLAEQGDELLLIDQHAAAERVLYEKFLAGASTENAPRQRLLTPFIWNLPPDQAETIRAFLPTLERLGFGLDIFGPQSFALKEWPALLPELRHAKRFLEILLEALQHENPHGPEEAQHEAVARAACRAAIKANDSVGTAEVAQLLKDLAACERPMTCPHGRPTHIRLPLGELHRRFRRT